jgi:hypothetical protein
LLGSGRDEWWEVLGVTADADKAAIRQRLPLAGPGAPPRRGGNAGGFQAVARGLRTRIDRPGRVAATRRAGLGIKSPGRRRQTFQEIQMVATVYTDSSPLALALPQVGHAALAAVQVTPGLGTRMGMPNRTTTGLWGNGRFLSGPEVGPGPDCCSGAPGLGNVPSQKGACPRSRGAGQSYGQRVSPFFHLGTFPPPGRTRSPGCVQAPGLGNLSPFKGIRRERLSHSFPSPGRTRNPGCVQAPGLGTCPRSRGPVLAQGDPSGMIEKTRRSLDESSLSAKFCTSAKLCTRHGTI